MNKVLKSIVIGFCIIALSFIGGAIHDKIMFASDTVTEVTIDVDIDDGTTIANGNYVSMVVTIDYPVGEAHVGDIVTVNIPPQIGNLKVHTKNSSAVEKTELSADGTQWLLTLSEDVETYGLTQCSFSIYGNVMTSTSEEGTTFPIVVEGQEITHLVVGPPDEGGSVIGESRPMIKFPAYGLGVDATYDGANNMWVADDKDAIVYFMVAVNPAGNQTLSNAVVEDRIPDGMVLLTDSLELKVTSYDDEGNKISEVSSNPHEYINSINTQFLKADFGHVPKGKSYMLLYGCKVITNEPGVLLENNATLSYTDTSGTNLSFIQTVTTTLREDANAQYVKKWADKTVVGNIEDDQLVKYTLLFKSDAGYAENEISIYDYLHEDVRFVACEDSPHISATYDSNTHSVYMTNSLETNSGIKEEVYIIVDFSGVSPGTVVENSIPGSSITTTKKPASVKLLKVDDMGNPLSGAEFELFHSNGTLYTNPETGLSGFTTDAEGAVYVTDLEPGNYYFVETKAPDGFELEASKLYFVLSGSQSATLNLTKSNQKSETGALAVSKVVTGHSLGDKKKAFDFTVSLDLSISGTYGDMIFTDGVAQFQLKDSETVTATGLPVGVTYTVTEADYSGEGYTTIKNGETGAILKDVTLTADFTNQLLEENTTEGGYPDEPDDEEIVTSGTLIIEKKFTGHEIVEAVTFLVTGPEGYSKTFSYEDMIEGQYKLSNLAFGAYEIKEKHAEVDGYKWRAEGLTTVELTPENVSQTLLIENLYTEIEEEVASLDLVVYKRLIGQKLQEGMFSFVLIDKMTGDIVETVENTKYGNFLFSRHVYTTPGTYTYMIKEVNGADKNYVYDSKVVDVQVVVEKSENGLQANAVYSNDRTFENVYVQKEVPDSADSDDSLVVNVPKTGYSNTLKLILIIVMLFSGAGIIFGITFAIKERKQN